MKTVWTKHLSNDTEKQQFINEILGSKRVLARLGDLIDELEHGLEEQELSPKAYDNPNWAFRQAHVNGMKSVLRKIKSLTSLDQA